MGRREEAEPLLKEVLAKHEQKLGPDHPDTLATRHNLASLYMDMGRREEAETLLKEVLAKREQKLGPDHPSTLATRGMLGFLFAQIGRSQEAGLLLEEVLAGQEQKLGHDHPHTLITRAALDRLRARSDRSDDHEAPEEQPVAAAGTYDWAPGELGRFYGIEGPVVGGLAEDPEPRVPEGPAPPKEP